MAAIVDFINAASLAEALSELADSPADTIVVAGGTDVMIQLPRGELGGSSMLHIGRIAELEGIRVNGTITIGALTCHRELAQSAALAAVAPSISAAAATVGGWQTQYAGTIGGNICNASPAADVAPPLLVHDACVELASTSGTRELPLAEFFLGRRKTARRHDELVTAFRFERPPERSADVYLKVGRRGGMEVAIVGLALRLTLSPDGYTITDARCAAASLGPRPRRFAEVEQLLASSSAADSAIAKAADALAHAITPISDSRASEQYRRDVTPRLFSRAAAMCIATIRSRL